MRIRYVIPLIICAIIAAACYKDAIFYGEHIRIAEAMLYAYGANLLLVSVIPFFPLIAGYGVLSFFRARSDEDAMPLPLALAFGWGLLSLLMWLLGVLGAMLHANLFSRLVPIILVPLLYLCFRSSVRTLAKRIRSAFAASLPQLSQPISLLLILALVLIIARHAVVLPLPSTSYDVLEYHLPDVQTALATGSIAPDPGNVYSLMPQGVEMLYAFGSLFGGAVGAMAPNLINLYLALTAALLAGLIVSELLSHFSSASPNSASRSSIAPLSAAVIFLGHLVTFVCLSDALSDMGPSVYVSAAILCWLRALRLGKPLEFWLSGIFLGFAVSCKYPAAGVGVIPFLLISPLFPKSVLPFDEKKTPLLFARIFPAIFVAAVAGLAYLPWLIRAFFYDGSLFPPLTIGSLRSDMEQYAIREFMAQAHQSQAIFSWDYLAKLWHRLPHAGTILGAGALYFSVIHRRSALLCLPLFVLAGYLIWNTVPNSAERFLTPLLPTLIALAVAAVYHLRCLSKIASAIACIALVGWIASTVIAFTALAFNDGYLARVVGATTDQQYLEHRLHVTGEFFNAVNAELDKTKSPRLLLVYEARKAAFHAPSISNTVFDPSTLWMLLRSEIGKDPRQVMQALAAQGITHIAVNEAELARLIEFYPVPDAKDDPEFMRLKNSSSTGLNPALLPFRRYYAPFYYFGADEWAEMDARLSRFFEETRKSVVWEKNIGGARIWLSRIAESRPPGNR